MAVDGGQDHTLKVRPWRRKVNITPFIRIVSQEYPGQGTEADPYLIDWLNDDAENPMTWATPYKFVRGRQGERSTMAVEVDAFSVRQQMGDHLDGGDCDSSRVHG
jgi:hypothetical protein